jgi:hypothetical protein
VEALSGGSDGARWPAELTFLLERHPRATWPVRRSASVEFWLAVHERLRRDCAGLAAIADEYRAGRHAAPQLAIFAAPRLRGLIAAMHGHHQIEDVEYFHAFRRTEPRLARGFDLLEREHAELNADVDAALAALGELRAAAERAAQAGAAATLALAAQRYVEITERLCERLLRHLNDEEDLVVPLLLEHADS